jgi:hypothetical protein
MVLVGESGFAPEGDPGSLMYPEIMEELRR